MVKRCTPRRAAVPRRKLRPYMLLPLLAPMLALAPAGPAAAAWKFSPSITVRETYTDNINQARDELAQDQFITEITPGFTLINVTPRLKFRGTYQYHYYKLSDESAVTGNAGNSRSQLLTDIQSELINELLYFDAYASISQQAISAFGPQVNDNGYSGVNKATVKTFRASPYLRRSFGTTANAEVRYTLDSVDAGDSGLGKTDSNALLFLLSSGPSFRKVGWSVVYNRQELRDTRAPDSTIQTATLNLRYILTPSFSLTGATGYDDYDYQSLGGRTKGSFHQLGFSWVPSQRTSLTASAGKRYYGDSYYLQAVHRSRSTTWNISYNDAVTSTRGQFLLPATVNTAALLNDLFRPDIPDPVARQLAVEAYMRATGLPPSLANNINYFSNRYSVQKQFQASVAMTTRRSTLVLTAFDTRREALSSVETDSPLTGTGRSDLNDNVRQRGVAAMYNMRLTARSNANLSLTKSSAESITTGLESDNTALRLSFNRSFGNKLNGTMELRHIRGTTLSSTASYRENAISASLSLQF